MAEVCDVSRRTIFRDLNALRRAGVPAKFRADRQGYGVASGFFLDPPRFVEDEILALILLSHGPGAGETEALRRAARSGALKCAEALPSEERGRALALAESIEAGREHRVVRPGRLQIYQSVIRALAERRQLRAWYREPGEAEETVSKISPYRLVVEGDVWCLVGRSSLHRGVRILKLPWIHRLELTDDRAEIPPRFRASRHLGCAGHGDRRCRVELRFSPRIAPEVSEYLWHPTQRIEPEPAGGVRLSLSVDDPGHLERWIRSFGSEVEVLSPRSLRQRIGREALKVAKAHLGAKTRPDESAIEAVAGAQGG